MVVPPDIEKVDRKKSVRRAWPEKIQVVEERPVDGCNCGLDQSPVPAPMPPQVIEKELCGLGLLAHVVLSKDIEHRPLDRVQQELAHKN